MNKKYIAGLLTLVMLVSFAPTSQAFKDIPQPMTQYAAEGLASIGILSQVDNFYPDNFLTRSQFCKMAVLAKGFNELSVYSSYTLYPDVRSTEWYAPYVNAAVRKFNIIKAYPNGFFGPEDTISYGQAVTILLRSLGWEDKDIGFNWPQDFIFKANELGLTQGISQLGANDPIPRADAALLISNMLMMNVKGGASLISTSFTVIENVTLIGTSQTNADLKTGEVMFLEGTEKKTYYAPTIPTVLVGLTGTAVFDKNISGALKGFMPNTKGASIVSVKSAEADGIITESGKILIPKATKTLVLNEISEYATAWFDIKAQDNAVIYRDTVGNITSISIIGKAASGKAIVFGVDSFKPALNAVFVKNGTAISVDKLEKYDVLTHTEATNTYHVSDKRLSLRYENSGPTYQNPSYVILGGTRFEVSDKVSPMFNDIEFNTVITVLLDVSDNIQGVVTDNTQQKAPRGILTKLSDTEFEAKLDNGFTLKGVPNFNSGNTTVVNGEVVNRLYESVGRLVTVAQNNTGKYSISPAELAAPTRITGEYLEFTAANVSPNVKVYEQAGPGFPLHEVDIAKHPRALVSSIKGMELDRTGKISTIIADNITENLFYYGFLTVSTEEVPVPPLNSSDTSNSTTTQYTVSIMTADGVKSYSSNQNPGVGTMYRAVGAVAKDAFNESKRAYSPVKTLNQIGKVTRDSFDSLKGIRIDGRYLPLNENVQVYIRRSEKYISLAEARVNFNSFTLYGDQSVCFIIVE